MAVQRVLGATWAALHGPKDADGLLQWLLEARFVGLVPSPTPRPLDWRALARASSDYPVQFPAVRVDPVVHIDNPPMGLAAAGPEEVAALHLRIERAVAIAEVLSSEQILLDPGPVPLVGEVLLEDLAESEWSEAAVGALRARRAAALPGALDRACRSLFDLCKRHPDRRFCLTPGRSLRSLADPESLSCIFEDLSGQRLGYWHDTAVAARREQLLGEPQGEWLEKFCNRLSGCTLGDSADGGLYLPPGAGGVDYPLLGTYLPRAAKGVSACVELDPAVVMAEIPGIRDCLDKFGL